MRAEPRPERQAGIRPFPSLWRAIDATGRRLVPFTATLVVVVALGFPFGIAGQPELRDAVLLISVYFWSIYRPGSMPPSAAFVLGLLADLLGPEPPGITALVLLALGGVAIRLRVALLRQGLLTIWLAFVGLAAAAEAALWALTASLDLRVLPPLPALFSFGLAAGLYPLVAAALIGLHRGLAAPERA